MLILMRKLLQRWEPNYRQQQQQLRMRRQDALWSHYYYWIRKHVISGAIPTVDECTRASSLEGFSSLLLTNWTGHWGERMQFNWKIGHIMEAIHLISLLSPYVKSCLLHMLIDQVGWMISSSICRFHNNLPDTHHFTSSPNKRIMHHLVHSVQEVVVGGECRKAEVIKVEFMTPTPTTSSPGA